MSDRTLLGSTTETSMELSLDALGAPGTQTELIVTAMFPDRDNDNPLRLSDTAQRSFEVKAKLSKSSPSTYDFDAAFDRTHGGSFLLLPEDEDSLTVDLGGITVQLDVNEHKELSLASSTIVATEPEQARFIFADMLTRYLDRMAYLASAPIYVALTVVRDIKHEVQYTYVVAPPRSALVGTGSEFLADEMKAIYALYREGMNANSSYYKVLCFYKILEGLLGPLRAAVQHRARIANIDVRSAKDTVPDHPDFPKGLRQHVGSPIKGFCDVFLSKQFRDAMAHFTLRQKSALDVSSPRDVSRFTDLAFVANLCARAVISKHEEALLKFYNKDVPAT